MNYRDELHTVMNYLWSRDLESKLAHESLVDWGHAVLVRTTGVGKTLLCGIANDDGFTAPGFFDPLVSDDDLIAAMDAGDYRDMEIQVSDLDVKMMLVELQMLGLKSHDPEIQAYCDRLSRDLMADIKDNGLVFSHAKRLATQGNSL